MVIYFASSYRGQKINQTVVLLSIYKRTWMGMLTFYRVLALVLFILTTKKQGELQEQTIYVLRPLVQALRNQNINRWAAEAYSNLKNAMDS